MALLLDGGAAAEAGWPSELRAPAGCPPPARAHPVAPPPLLGRLPAGSSGAHCPGPWAPGWTLTSHITGTHLAQLPSQCQSLAASSCRVPTPTPDSTQTRPRRGSGRLWAGRRWSEPPLNPQFSDFGHLARFGAKKGMQRPSGPE